MHDGSFQLLQSEFIKSASYAQLFDIHHTGEGQYGYTYSICTTVAMGSMMLNASDDNCITFVQRDGDHSTCEFTVPYDHHASALFYSKDDWINYLKIGDIVDAKDDQEKWYESVIRYIEMKQDRKLLYVHYIGWNKKWDEEIFADDFKRIAKRNSITAGPHRHANKKYYHCYDTYPQHYSDY